MRLTAAEAAFLVAGVYGTSELVPFLNKPRGTRGAYVFRPGRGWGRF